MKWLFSVLLLFVLFGCAQNQLSRKMSPEKLLHFACDTGTTVKEVSGSIWVDAESKEFSGKLPADVRVWKDGMDLEVTHALGGTQARIKVRGDRFEITSSGESKPKKGSGSWGGIPLKWATPLFLGKVPCATNAIQKKQSRLSNDEGDLTVETDEEKYVYQFKDYGERPWPISLQWLNKKDATTIAFTFDSPDEKLTFSPLKWSARSSLGYLSVRWKERDVKE